VESTGDVQLDIRFSDHHYEYETLLQFGAVVRGIHARCGDAEICFWAFIHYVSRSHPTILRVTLETGMAKSVEEVMRGVELPEVVVQARAAAPLPDFPASGRPGSAIVG
jgi:hypothetical protein